jgi:hypothetical protein
MKQRSILVDLVKLDQIIDQLELDKEKKQNGNIKARQMNNVLGRDAHIMDTRR